MRCFLFAFKTREDGNVCFLWLEGRYLEAEEVCFCGFTPTTGRSCFLYLFMQSEMEILTEAEENMGQEPVKTPGLWK